MNIERLQRLSDAAADKAQHGVKTYSELAEEFHCSIGTISDIIRRRTWKHLP